MNRRPQRFCDPEIEFNETIGYRDGLNQLDGFESISLPTKLSSFPFSIDPTFLENGTDQYGKRDGCVHVDGGIA